MKEVALEAAAMAAEVVEQRPQPVAQSEDELSLSQHQNPLQRTTGTALGLWETMKD